MLSLIVHLFSFVCRFARFPVSNLLLLFVGFTYRFAGFPLLNVCLNFSILWGGVGGVLVVAGCVCVCAVGSSIS